MNKTELLALALQLGLNADESMTVEQLQSLIKSYKKDTVADATNTGKSALSSFRYTKEYCIGTLKNGVTGIIGTPASHPFATMLTLKGSGIELQYTFLQNKSVEGKTYKQYRMEWSVL